MTNRFIWVDLSTFDMRAAKRFYRQCFAWHYRGSGDGYVLCESHQQPAACLYTMPTKFQQMEMPSFWMSYIHVTNLESTVELAKAWGGIVEIQPQPFSGGGSIALIRDPSGAGFTCYEGSEFEHSKQSRGQAVWHELHVSNLMQVKDFYTNVFEWTIQPSGHRDRYEIFGSADDPIAGIQITPNEIKGDKEYWGVYFAVESLPQTTKIIEQAGGTIAMKQPLGERQALLAYDPQGAAFYILEDQSGETTATQTGSTFKWRAILGLIIVAIAVIFELNWIWGMLFCFWVIPDLQSGTTHFLEPINRQDNPIVYWLIMGTWIFLSLYLLLSSFI